MSDQAPSLFRILFVRLRFILVFVAVGLVVGNWGWIMNAVDKADDSLFPAPAEADKTLIDKVKGFWDKGKK